MALDAANLTKGLSAALQQAHVHDELSRSKLAKLEEQKELADKLNHVLTKEGGLIASAQLTCKNLEVAVAVAKRPGFFDYYQPTDEVKRVYQTGECGSLARKISRTQRELDTLDKEIEERARLAKTQREVQFTPSVGSLDEWFATYGRPDPAKPAIEGRLTSFDKNPKIYGGTGLPPASDDR